MIKTVLHLKCVKDIKTLSIYQSNFKVPIYLVIESKFSYRREIVKSILTFNIWNGNIDQNANYLSVHYRCTKYLLSWNIFQMCFHLFQLYQHVNHSGSTISISPRSCERLFAKCLLERSNTFIRGTARILDNQSSIIVLAVFMDVWCGNPIIV